jgi:uncharacterized alkaline shock family protein YloU
VSGPYVIRGGDGTITVASAVLESVARRAAESVPDARVRRRGLDVEVDGARARVSLELAVRYGAVLPDVARAVQERVAAELRGMCGLEPAEVDVAVEELVSR